MSFILCLDRASDVLIEIIHSILQGEMTPRKPRPTVGLDAGLDSGSHAGRRAGSKAKPKLGEDELFDYAVRSLAARASSADELRFKLRRRAAKLSDIDPVIARLKDIGYLDDRRFAEMYTTIRVENEGLGRARVLSDLRGRRVAPKLAEKAVAQAFAGRDEQEMVAAYMERRIPSIAAGGHTGDERKLAAAYRKLRRAGFSSGPILTVLKRYAANPELLDEAPPEDEPEDT